MDTRHGLVLHSHAMKQAPPILLAILVMAAVVTACSRPGSAVSSGGPAPAADPLSALIRFYQGPLNHLSAVRRGECPMAPSCAEYAHQAIAAHGPLIGWVMAHDRLLRCDRDETDNAARVVVNGRWKFYDPVSANDFWWRNNESGLGETDFE